MTKLSEQVTAAVAPNADSRVKQLDATTLTIDGVRYAVVTNFHDAYDQTRLAERYNDILSKYDYIVGDWGYDQLRLRGFYATGNRRASRDQTIDTLQDYLYEYCNFGCAYFVLQRLDAPTPRPKRNAKPSGRRKPAPYRETRVTAVQLDGKQAATAPTSRAHGRRFQIRTRHDKE